MRSLGGATTPVESSERQITDAAVTTSSLRVLLVDDSRLNQKLAEAILQKQGHRVTIANHGREALEHWRSGNFDLILMDIQMPEMDGFEATREIRAQEQARGDHIPIIAMTANVLKEEVDSCYQAGMNDFIGKPFDTNELLLKIYNLKTKNLTTLSINLYDSMNLYGLEAVPSKNGNYLLLSATDSQNKNPELYVLDITNKKLLKMPFKSFVDKCTFTNGNKNIYCAYSNSFSNNNFSYPFDYYLGLIPSQDSFAKVNLETGEFTIFIENTPYDAYNLQISEDESFLIFINKYDGLLYKLDLTNQEV